MVVDVCSRYHCSWMLQFPGMRVAGSSSICCCACMHAWDAQHKSGAASLLLLSHAASGEQDAPAYNYGYSYYHYCNEPRQQRLLCWNSTKHHARTSPRWQLEAPVNANTNRTESKHCTKRRHGKRHGTQVVVAVYNEKCWLLWCVSMMYRCGCTCDKKAKGNP
jgi:hypothetical protein